MQAGPMEAAMIANRRSGLDRRKGERRKDPSPRATLPSGFPDRRKGGDRRTVVRRVADRVPLEIARGLEILKKASLPPQELFQRLIDRIASSLMQAFSVEMDEVAILLLKDQGLALRFAYPPKLYLGKTNSFPVNSPSIAGEVLRTRKGRIDNDVHEIRHLGIYERIPLKDKGPLEIQKMATSPLLLQEGRAIGVVQVSRKGRSPKEAGANFSPFDLLKLNDLGGRLGSYLHGVIPADF